MWWFEESVERPWNVFVQIKEILEPGMGIALTGNPNAPLRLSMRHPDRFPAMLNYHTNVLNERLNAGACVDTSAIHKHFGDPTHSDNRAPRPIPSSFASSSRSRIFPAFALQSRGHPLATEFCADWNEKRSCPEINACKYRHEHSGRRKGKHPSLECIRERIATTLGTRPVLLFISVNID